MLNGVVSNTALENTMTVCVLFVKHMFVFDVMKLSNDETGRERKEWKRSKIHTKFVQRTVKNGFKC